MPPRLSGLFPVYFFGSSLDFHLAVADTSRMETNASSLPFTAACTILQQLGGKMFCAMVGARDFVYGDSPAHLSFKIGRNAKGVTHVKIALEADDTYSVSFLAKRGSNATTKHLSIGVYADQLAPIFTAHTGLYTRL